MALPAAAAAQPDARPGVGRVPVGAARQNMAAERAPIDAASRKRCIPADRIAGAVVTGFRSVEIVMRGGARWRLRFIENCPQLGYYAGFYYKRREAGRLCAGRDKVIARSGGECPIAAIQPIRNLPPARSGSRQRR